MIKRQVKTIVHYGIKGAKKGLASNPKLKEAIKRSLLPHLKTRDKSVQERWIEQNFPDFIEIAKLRKEQEAFTYKPLVSVIIPTYNTDIDFLHDCIGSVIGQVYENWELCIVDDCSPSKEVRKIIEQYAEYDDRIKYKFLDKNVNISRATNEAVAMASGDFVALFDHDDLLWPNALFEVVKALNQDESLDLIYTDEDKITEDRFNHLGTVFKPDWNPDFLHSVNYITHFTVIRKSLYEKIGGESAEYDGAQDWDLFMRATHETDKIYHVPKVVYSWRIHDQSTAKSTDAKPYVVEAQCRALEADLVRKGYPEAAVERDPEHSGYWRVNYPVVNSPLISIVIPSKNQYRIIKRCIDSIYAKTTYRNYEIVLVDTGSDDERVLRWYRSLTEKHSNLRIVNWPEKPFSYARSCNEGARVAKGDLLVMLNNDTEVITPDWLELMAGDALRKEVAAVGPLLFFPDGYHIQHAGVGVGLGGVAANSFSMMTLEQPMSQTQHLMLNTKHNMTAVTAACLMIRKDLFTEVGGFDEKFRVSYNDVDLCLRLYAKGYQNVYTPYARLLHHESISLGLPEEVAKRDTQEFRDAQKLFKRRWKKYIEHDPNLNPNLDKSNAFYDISHLNVGEK